MPITKKEQQSSNPSLVSVQRRIPYLPELRSYCGSVCAVLIMQQLEYWFANFVNGFYKFLAPCKHPRYKVGDSWTEELNFTVREFRTGFDKNRRALQIEKSALFSK